MNTSVTNLSNVNALYCLVHGFENEAYTVREGDSVTITFGRNMKGQTSFPRLSLAGTIISEGDGAGEAFVTLLAVDKLTLFLL